MTCSGVVLSCPLVSRGTDVDLLSEFVIFMINCSILIAPSPKIGGTKYLQFGWNLVPHELVPVPKTPPVTPLLKGIDMVKSWPGQVKNIIYCTRQLIRIRFHCVAKETMELWAFLWPIYSGYEIYLCLFPLISRIHESF